MPRRENGFTKGDFVVYPTHGVGKVTGFEEKHLSGASLKFMVVNFEKDRMTLRVPVHKVETSGMRRLSSREKMKSAMVVLKGRPRVKRTMWSRRAQEYEAKINSGDPESIAEVVRDLHGRVGQADQSYSERQLYEAALDRLVRELCAVERIDPTKAVEQVTKHLKIA
jgi:CarD family transcriptional regulator